MKVVSVINYKGGVGKTTLTANLGAYVAMRGYRVLLIDLDPQTHLTFSFISHEEWRDKYKSTTTLKNYFYSLIEPKGNAVYLSSLVIPLRLERCKNIGLISSSLELTDLDMDLVGSCGTGTDSLIAGAKLRMYNYLYTGLLRMRSDYDLVLIDCPPNCNASVRNALVASDYYLIPARMDYLSSLGISNLTVSMLRFFSEYNEYVKKRPDLKYEEVRIKPLGVVPMMVGFTGLNMLTAHKWYMKELKDAGYNVFPYLRESQKNFSVERVEEGPVVLTPDEVTKGTKQSPISRILQDLYAIGDEFLYCLGMYR